MRLSRTPAAVLMVAALMLEGCGAKEIRLDSSGQVPAASSVAKVSSTDNGNTRIELTVEHLAPPDRVAAGATVYVVWVRGRQAGSRAQGLGALRLDDKLNGSLSAVTPLRDFDLFVTAEAAQTAMVPTGDPLLYTTVAMR